MKEIQVTIKNKDGLHARPAGVLVKKAGEFQSKIEIQFNGKSVNAKSLMSLLSLGVKTNSDLTIRAEGQDADAALAGLQNLIQNDSQFASGV